jgi:hypothetical protein
MDAEEDKSSRPIEFHDFHLIFQRAVPWGSVIRSHRQLVARQWLASHHPERLPATCLLSPPSLGMGGSGHNRAVRTNVGFSGEPRGDSLLALFRNGFELTRSFAAHSKKTATKSEARAAESNAPGKFLASAPTFATMS